MIKNYIYIIKNKAWFVLAFYSSLGFLLSVSSIIINSKYSYHIYKFLPELFILKPEISKTILATLVSSLLTITVITFSTIMVVLTTYSSQFSPRTLQDFITDKITLKVLGIFMGGFIYSIISLTFIKDTSSNYNVISALLGVLISIICLIFFAYFIHHVSISIQVNKLIDSLTNDVLNTISKLSKKKPSDIILKSKDFTDIEVLISTKSKFVFPHKSGNIQIIDDIRLLNLAIENDIIIKLEKSIGDYVTCSTSIATIFYKNTKNFDKDIVLKYIIIGNERTIDQDIEYALNKITDIALKAISPSINDPNTAINCTRQLGMILSKLEDLDFDSNYYHDSDDNLRLILNNTSFDEIMYKTFYQLRYYSIHDLSVTVSILDALIIVANSNKTSFKDSSWTFSNYILSGFDSSVLESLDKKFLNKKIKMLATLTNNLNDVRYFY